MMNLGYDESNYNGIRDNNDLCDSLILSYFNKKELRYNQNVLIYESSIIPIIGIKHISCTEENIFIGCKSGIQTLIFNNNIPQLLHILGNKYVLHDTGKDTLLISDSESSITYLVKECNIFECLKNISKTEFNRFPKIPVQTFEKIFIDSKTRIDLTNTNDNITTSDQLLSLALIKHSFIEVYANYIKIKNFENNENTVISNTNRIVSCEKIIKRSITYLQINTVDEKCYFYVGNTFSGDSEYLEYNNEELFVQRASLDKELINMALSEHPSLLNNTKFLNGIDEGINKNISVINKEDIENRTGEGPNILYMRKFRYYPILLNTSINYAYVVIRKILNIKGNDDYLQENSSSLSQVKRVRNKRFSSIFDDLLNFTIPEDDVIQKAVSSLYRELVTEILFENNFQDSQATPIDGNNESLLLTRLLSTNIFPFLFTNSELNLIMPCAHDYQYFAKNSPDALFYIGYNHTYLENPILIAKNIQDHNLLVFLGTLYKVYFLGVKCYEEGIKIFLQNAVVSEANQKYYLFLLSSIPFDSGLVERFLKESIILPTEGTNLAIVGFGIKYFNTGNSEILDYLITDILKSTKLIHTAHKDYKLLLAISIFLINNKSNKFITFDDDHPLVRCLISQQGYSTSNSFTRDQSKFYFRLFENISKKPNFKVKDGSLMIGEKNNNGGSSVIDAADVFYILIEIINSHMKYTAQEAELIVSKLIERISTCKFNNKSRDENSLYFDYTLITATIISKIYELSNKAPYIDLIRILRRKLREKDSDKGYKCYVNHLGLTRIYNSGFSSVCLYKELLGLLLSSCKIKITESTYRLVIIAFFLDEYQLPEVTEISFFKSFAFSQLIKSGQPAIKIGLDYLELKSIIDNKMRNNFDLKYFVDVVTDFLENYTEKFYDNRNKKYFIDDASIEYLMKFLN